MVCGHGSRGGSTLAPHNLIRIAAVAATRARHSDWAGQVTDLPSIRGNWSKDHDGHWIGRAGQRFGRQFRLGQLRLLPATAGPRGTEDGFNTDDGHQADNKEGVFTHSIKFSDMQTVTIKSIQYYELRLDLNEGNAAGDPPINLTELRLFASAEKATGTDYDADFAGL